MTLYLCFYKKNCNKKISNILENILANIKSSKKFLIKSEIQRKYNTSNRSKLRTFIKKVNIEIKNKNKNLAKKLYIVLQKIIDRQTTKGLIHKNKAARFKSNIFKKITNME